MPGTGLDYQRGIRAALAEDDELRAGLLHDLGHQMMTLSLLAESVRDDSAPSVDARRRMELVMQEMFRIVDIIADSTGVETARPVAAGAVDIRRLANEIAQLAVLAHDTTVAVEPGGPAVIEVGPTLMWRVLANLVDNAVMAAGPGGRVDIKIEQELDTVVEVVDSGPGFGCRGPDSTPGTGLTVVRQLLDDARGRLEITDRPGGGARVRAIFGVEREYQLASTDAGPWH